mgnify:CR=1 FL=1
MRKDVLFRGCTRPAMFLGVPYVPFFIGAGACLLLAVYVNLLLLALMLISAQFDFSGVYAWLNKGATPKVRSN